MANRMENNIILAGKMINGARALHELFEKAQGEGYCDYKYLAEKLKENFQLTISQSKILDGVICRTEKARGIINYLEDRFGINEKRDFVEPSGLYELLFEKPATCNLTAHSYNIGIRFEKSSWRYSDKIGFVEHHTLCDQLDKPLDITIKRLEEKKATNCSFLTFVMPSREAYEKMIKRKRINPTRMETFICSLFGGAVSVHSAERYFKAVSAHELRHVIDNIIGPNLLNNAFTETRADLYRKSLDGIKRDYANNLENISKRIRISQESLSLPMPYILKEQIFQLALERQLAKKKIYENVYPSVFSALAQIPKEMMPAMSYLPLFYTSHIKNIPHWLGLVNEYLNLKVN